MPIKYEGIQFLAGDAAELDRIRQVPVLPVFSGFSISFLAALSKELLADSRTRAFPDVTSYAFWIRKASLERQRAAHPGAGRRMGRGVAFHIAPSNVPVNFAVSFTSCLLAGNACIVRVSDKDFEQVAIICDAVNRLAQSSHPEAARYLFVLRYPHDAKINQLFTDLCDIRVIWGGNQTIEIIRKTPLPPRAVELTFADRFSFSVIDANAYLAADAAAVAEGFYIDTFYTDQNACSSPRLVVWMGENVEQARARFWQALAELVKDNYDLKPIQSVDKMVSFCELAATHRTVHLDSADNYIVRVLLDSLAEDIMAYKNGGGYFFEYIAGDLRDIVPVMGKACQTVSYLGVDPAAICEVVQNAGVRGVDRIVPLGKTMELSFIWDGYDMVEAMSRIVDVMG